jgi:hypothetical protein
MTEGHTISKSTFHVMNGGKKSLQFMRLKSQAKGFRPFRPKFDHSSSAHNAPIQQLATSGRIESHIQSAAASRADIDDGDDVHAA